MTAGANQMTRRVNVGLRPSARAAGHYSRAVRVGDTVLQSGTTAIDRQGNVRGEGDVASRSRPSCGSPSGAWARRAPPGRRVRSRLYVTDVSLADQAALAVARYFKDARPAATLVQVNRLARPAQLIEMSWTRSTAPGRPGQRISSGRPLEAQLRLLPAVRVGDRVFISGSTALNVRGQVEAPGDMYRQTRVTMDTILAPWRRPRRARRHRLHQDLPPDLSKAADYTRAWLEALGDVRPTSTLLASRG